MKKIYSFALAAVAILSAASCQKEMANEAIVDNGGDAFKVTAISATDSKTVLDGVNTYWTPGDQIALYNENGAEVTFTTDITETAAKAVFTAESAFVPHADGLLAVYPKRTDRDATSYADGVVTGLHIGGTQQAVAGSFDPKFAVALGVALPEESNDLLFVNIHSLVKFTVGGETAPATVTLKNNGERKIAGTYNVEISEGQATVTEGADEITLNGPFEVGKTYYIALVYGECENGISLYFDDVEVKNTGETITLEPNKIYNLGTLSTAAEPEEPKEPAKLWTKKPVADLAGYDAAQKVRLAAYGDYVLVANGAKVYALNAADGAVAATYELPAAVQSICTDDAGNILVATDANFGGVVSLYTIADPANPTPELLKEWNTGNYYGTDAGNVRVKGNLKGDAVITATVSAGAGGAVIMWPVEDGVCGTWYWTSVPYEAGLVAYCCAAPAGDQISDGLFYIGYNGSANDLYYAASPVMDGASEWALSYVTGSGWKENWNSISTAEWKGNNYLAILASCHFDYDEADAHLLNVNNPAAAELVYSYSGELDVDRNEGWANLDWTAGGTYSDILLMSTADALLMVYVDGNYGAMSCVAIY